MGVTTRPYRLAEASSTKNVNHVSLRSADRTVTLSCAPALYTERSFVQPWSVSRLLPKVSHGRFPARVPVRFPLAPRRRIELGLPPSQIVRERQLPLLGPCRHRPEPGRRGLARARRGNTDSHPATVRFLHRR